MFRVYDGFWNKGMPYVRIRGAGIIGDRRLRLRNDLYPCGKSFLWGELREQTVALALALLADVTGSDGLALHYCERFAADVVRKLTEGVDFRLHTDAIKDWCFNSITEELFPGTTFTTEKPGNA